MSHGRHRKKSKNVVLIDIINSLLKTGNKTAIINVKKLQFIHSVNGDGSKTAKMIKIAMLTTHNIDIQAMLVWLTLPFYHFLRFLICRR